MTGQDISNQLQARVKQAFDSGSALCIRGGGSKDFYGREAVGDQVDVSPHAGITNYEPTELVISARAGTPLREIEQTLDRENQMLAFEPPHFGATATLGGTVACNLSGPRRARAGAARDFVLGTRILNGRGEILTFGGEVMKNVAGYDVSRLMSGALGTLGILLEISLKVIPKPHSEITLARQASVREALDTVHTLAQKPYPVSATCFDGEQLYLRLSGAESSVESSRKLIGGESIPQGDQFWHKLREQQHGFFATGKVLWRLSVASDTPPVEIDGKWLYEWGGAQRWLISEAPLQAVRGIATGTGGHATLYRDSGAREDVFQPLPPGLMSIHRKLKQAFDPNGILNPGRMYRGL
jgi:glycolate oxidase FAD binding subunit